MFASGDGIFAQLPFIRFLTDRSKLADIKTRRIKLVWQTDEYHDRLRQWMQSIMDDEDVEFDLLDISIHVSQNAVQISGEAGPAGPVTKVKRMGQRLKVIHDVPDVESYIQLEMKEPRRQVAVSVSGHRRLREEVRLQVFRTRRLNVRLFESDFQPVTAYRDRGGTAA
ncbi:hypothetical protein CKM354_001127500 [Cercospora kikuchii]|uniref:Ferric reductase NAD binding domain-containing protein n=1 Tax=Cercospora kikuchii TaxID=84275 RepID=A0A9P3CYA5_9PEZI|nr:uncharacterized protein CKM354_001127500 [Cercospora kikuchii]GIZ48205.1 hypothetical protein CKM354_001127500 [Cercospora kikuchii]